MSQYPSTSTLIDTPHEVRVLFTIRASRNLYGYAYGPFRFDEVRKTFVYQARTFSAADWQAQGAELIQRFYKYRPQVMVEVVPVETLAEKPPAADHIVDTNEMVPPAAEHEPAPPPEGEAASSEVDAPAAPVKRSRAKAKPATPAAE